MKGEVADKLKALNAHRGGMDAAYNEVDSVYQEIRDHMMPTRGRFHHGEVQTRGSVNKKIIDATAQKAHRTLVSGLMSGVTSPSRPWFKLGTYDRDLQEQYEAKTWLHMFQSKMYDVLRASNSYRMFNHCYSDLGLYGAFGGFVVGDFDTVIHCHSMPMGSFRMSEDAKGNIDAMQYDCVRTVKQLVDQFGEENVSNEVRRAYKSNKLDDTVLIHHAIEVRRKRDPNSALSTDMPMASYYWEKGAKDKFLQESGYSTRNLLGPRWNHQEGDVWPSEWPALLALGDHVQLQVQHRDKAQAIQYSYKPPMIAPAGFNKRYRNVPGGVTSVASNNLQQGGLRPAVEVRPNVADLRMDIQETQRQISSAFFEDLFLMTSMSDRRQVTATEIAERHEEKLLVLGPVLESLDHGLLQPMIEATAHYMMESDMVPDPPESLEGVPLKIEYISLLAQAQKAVGVATIERAIGFAGTLAQVKPEVLDNLDADAAYREFTDQVGPPPNITHSPEDVAKVRMAKMQKAQQQQMLEAAEPIANTAKLLSEANLRGAEALDLGNGPV